jgi:hypothetical protein
MKTTSKQHKPKTAKKQRDTQTPLEDAYRRTFIGPAPNVPVRERLSMYKSVPSITTYGLFEKPV